MTLKPPTTLTFLIYIAVLLTGSAAPLPNLVVILTDDQGRGDYSAYGTADLRTPAIDRLFREGMDLANFRASSSVCSPTRAALMTGLYPDRAGVPGVVRTHPENSWGHLRPDATLLPQQLKAAGYHTALVGKWHLGLTPTNHPNARGFDYFHGFLGDMMDDYYTHLRHGNNYLRKNAEEIRPEGHATDLFTRWACAYLEERARTNRPFFLYLAYNAPHDPIQPPEDWLMKVQGRSPGLPPARARLVALIEHLDGGIGQVLNTLDTTGLAPETLVIFTSDNGGVVRLGANNGPWRDQKGSMYEGGLRVPFAARWPGRIRAGSRHPWPAVTMDIYPTLCAAAGVPMPGQIDGVSFLPVLLGQAAPAAHDLYFVRREGGREFGGKTVEALVRGEWKLLQNSPFEALELYHLGRDPAETNNLAGAEKKMFNELSAALRVQIQRGGQVPWQPN